MYSVELILTFFNVFTDFMEKTMPAITPSSESDDGIPQWLLYGVTVQGSAGDILEPDYNMENNPLYEMKSLSNDRHSHKTQTTAPVVPVYETIDSVVP